MNNSFFQIAGSPFLPYVKKQIESRVNYLNLSHTGKENINLLYDNKNSWYRVSSSVDIKEDHLLYKKYKLKESELAKRYVLQGGVITSNGGLRQGVGSNALYSYNSQGFKPMPGISNIDISTTGPLGTLINATIKIICYDIEQFEIIDSLYMKLGYSVFIEWGHNYYINDINGTISTTYPIDYFSINNREDLIKKVNNHKKDMCGNYDALLGIVSNFSWEFNNEGQYVCEIKVVGAGDVLESLKINQATSNELDNDENNLESSVIADKSLSILNKTLYNIYSNFYNKASSKDRYNTMVGGIKDKKYRKILNDTFSLIPNFIQFDENLKFTSTSDERALRGYYRGVMSGEDDVNDIPLINSSLFNVVTVRYQNNNGNDEGEDIAKPNVYITLGNLLAIIMCSGWIYESNNTSNKNPYIYIDFHDTLNFCHTFKGQLSLDPNVCLIPRNQRGDEDPFGIGILQDRVFDLINGAKHIDRISVKNQNINFNGQTHLLKEPTVTRQAQYEEGNKLKNLYLYTDNREVRANLMHILVNINHVTDLLKNERDKDKKGFINFNSFISSLFQDISKSLGGFNEFRLSIDESSKTLKIIDDNRLFTEKEYESIEEKYTVIPIFGKSSLAYKYSLKSKLDKNTSSMITIAAQARPETLGDDSFSFSNLAKYSEDRIMKYKTISDKQDKFELNNLYENDNTFNKKLPSLRKYLQGILEGIGNKPPFVIRNDIKESAYNTYKEIIGQYKLHQDPKNSGNVIIPITFELSMDGISGILPNSSFLIPPHLLPPTYKTKDGKTKVAFIIHKINQTFDKEKWITHLGGQIINVRNDEEPQKYDKPPSNISIQSRDTDPGQPGALKLPFEGDRPISSGFVYRYHPVSKTFEGHSGVDFKMPVGTKLTAMGDGKVTNIYETAKGGLQMLIEYNNGFRSGYAHLSKVLAKVGDLVNTSTIVAESGNTGVSTGPHLHLTLRKNGKLVDVTKYI